MSSVPREVLVEWHRLAHEGRLRAADQMLWSNDSNTISAIADLCFEVARENPQVGDMFRELGREMRRKASLKVREENGETVRMSAADYAAFRRSTEYSGTRFDKS